MRHDLHRHLWPDELVDALRDRSVPPCLRGSTLSLPDGDWEVDVASYGVEACLAAMDADRIDVAVVSLPPTMGLGQLAPAEATALADAYHAGARRACAEAGGRLLAYSLGRPLPGFAGTILAAPDLLDLEGLAPVLDELERQAGLLFVHPGPAPARDGAPSWWGAAVGYTAQMQAAYVAWLIGGVDRWTRVRVVFAILAGGAPVQLERLRSRGFDVRRAQRPNLYLDTASYGRRALELCLASLGAERLVFGSDAPVIAAQPTLEAVGGFGEAVAEAILSVNPRTLL